MTFNFSLILMPYLLIAVKGNGCEARKTTKKQTKISRATIVFRLFTQHTLGLGTVLRRSRKVCAPLKPQQNLEPYDYGDVLFTYSQNEQTKFTNDAYVM